MTTSDWIVAVRDTYGNRVGEVDDFQKLELRCRFNDVSTWSLTLNRQHKMAPELVQPGAGIIVYRKNQVFFSGLTLSTVQDVSHDQNVLTVAGEDDTTWLKRRLAHPQPGTSAPPYSSVAEDVRTGVASTVMQEFFLVNLGSSALSSRQVGITNAADPVLGPSLTGSGRWQSLLQLLQELAVASEAAGTVLGFEIKESGGAPQFRIYGAQDLTASVIFSPDRQNLAGFTYNDDAPTTTYAVAGGAGEGTARTILEKVSSLRADWGRIEGEFVDARHAADANELGQAADKALTEGAGATSVSIGVIDTEYHRFGTHYNLGDKVTVILDSLGPQSETVVAHAEATATGTTGKLTTLDAAATGFSVGLRVRVKQANGLLKDYGTRTVTDIVSGGGSADIFFTPPTTSATVAGDYLEGIRADHTPGPTIRDLVREVAVTLTEDGEHITPVVGNTSAKLRTINLFAANRALLARVRNLERR